MKKIVKILALVTVASLASCNKLGTYSTAPYVSLDSNGYSINESESGTELIVPVNLYNTSEGCTVSYTIDAVSAEDGVDFVSLDNSGSLNIPAGTNSVGIRFNVTGQPGVFTGNRQFRVRLSSASNGVTIGATNVCTVTIADLDHPLTDLFGTYSFSNVTLGTSGSFVYATYDITLSEYKDNPYRVWIDYITPWQSPSYYGAYCKNTEEIPGVYAEVSKDLSTITVPTPQTLAALVTEAFSGVPEEHYVLYTYVDEDDIFIGEPDTIVFERQDDGSYVTVSNYGLNIPSEYQNGLFYYYMNVWGDFNPSKYPARFVKK